jgi:hypothetical protein
MTLNLSPLRHIWLACLLTGFNLLLWTGCQSVSGNSSGGGSGVLTLSPSQVSFGNVNVGSNHASSVTIANTGTADLTINQATLSGAGFTMSNMALPMALHAGGSTSTTVTFAPTGGGSFSGSVTFATTGAQGNLSLPLSGTGVTQGQITPNPASLPFGNVQVGTSKSLSGTLTNSGGASLTISVATASGTGFTLSGLTTPLTLNAGQSTSYTIVFAPTANGSVTGNLSVTSDGTNPNLNVSLSGTGAAPGSLSANPSSVAFGSVQVGSTGSKSETVTNSGGVTVNISQANVTGSVFSLTGLALPTALTAGGSVTFTVGFAPTSAGAASGNLSLVSDAPSSPLNIALSGTGTTPGQLSVSPATLAFGNVAVGSNSPLTGSLSATGAAVAVSSESSNSSEFVLSGITLPATIAAGQSLGFTVTFTPNATGSATASLTFASNATNAPTVESLTGTGTAPAHSVALSWNASTGATSYDVYRGTATGVCSGTPTPYATAATTAYTDASVTAGTTYVYAVSAVNSAGQSACSTEASATIPTP